MAIDYALFAKLKAQGITPTFIKNGPATVALLVPQFDTVSGQPVDGIIQQTNLKELDDHITQINNTLASVQTVRDAVAQMLNT